MYLVLARGLGVEDDYSTVGSYLQCEHLGLYRIHLNVPSVPFLVSGRHTTSSMCSNTDRAVSRQGEPAHDCGPPYTPRPRAQQRWVHSCCSIAKLDQALANSDITAIEADIMVASEMQAAALRRDDEMTGDLPIMAHPSLFTDRAPETDLTFSDFLERCLSDGTRHLKLDFKQLAAVRPCLELLAKRWSQLHANGQAGMRSTSARSRFPLSPCIVSHKDVAANPHSLVCCAVWLNADILPGPNMRRLPKVPAHAFVPLCRQLCPHAVLSLGWCVGPVGPEQAYTEQDVKEMLRVCTEYALPGSSVVFAASVRFAERNISLLSQLVEQLAESQILFWTGTGELPIPPALQTSIYLQFASKGFADRVGFDVQLANSNIQHCASHCIDCTFVCSRWTRWLCCATAYGMSSPLPGQISDNRIGMHPSPPPHKAVATQWVVLVESMRHADPVLSQNTLNLAGERQPLVDGMSPNPAMRRPLHIMPPSVEEPGV